MSRRRGVLGCLATLALVALAGGVLFLVLGERSRRADERLLARWSELLGGASFVERFPPTEPNETAARLEVLGSAMGIEMAPADAADGPRPREESATRWAEIKPLLEEHVKAVAAAPSRGAWPPFAAELRGFLVEAKPHADEIVEILRDAPAPVWRSDLSRGFDAPLPNFLGLLKLQDLLVAQAALEAGDGRSGRSLELLQASWRLNQAVLARVSLLAQLVGQRAASRQAGILRGLCGVPPLWRDRLDELELQEGVFVALHAEAFMAYRYAALDPFPGDEFQGWSLPFMRWGLRDHARRFQRIIDDLAAEDVRTLDPDAYLERAMASLPRWQVVARIMLPNMFDAWPNSARHELAAELTSHTLARRELLADGMAAEFSPGTRAELASRRVAGLSWIVESDAAGVTIRLDGDLAHREDDAPPLQFRVERVDC